MKRLIVILILLSVLVWAPANAQGELGEERIDDWQVTININSDASLAVKEKIVYNFGAAQRHGIFRDLPYKYKRQGMKYNLRLSDFKVTDEKGNSLTFKVSRQGRYKRIKIGDADKLVSGRQVYIISYQVHRAINYFSDHDELYWNVTGDEWPVEIRQARAVVNLPTAVDAAKVKTACYAGPRGSRQKCVSSRYIYSVRNRVKSFSFTNDRLSPGEGMTVVVSWPKGIVAKPNWTANLWEIFKDNWIFGLPIVVFIILFYLWWTRGRDPKSRGTIIARYAPPAGITPAMVGIIIDEKIEGKDISAEIIYLAIKGYLRIIQTKKDGWLFKSTDWLLEKLKESDKNLTSYERKLMEGLFKKKHLKATTKDLIKAWEKAGKIKPNSFMEKMLTAIINLSPPDSSGKSKDQTNKPIVKLSSLKQSFYKDLSEIKKDIYTQAVAGGYFPKNPNKVRRSYLIIGIILSFSAWFLASIFGSLGGVSALVSSALVAVFGLFMPKKTKKGVEAREHILGLKEYLKVAEKERLKFHNAPEKSPKHFEELLPYAMVLGVEKEWAKQFKDIYQEQPDWYQGPTGGAFSAVILADSLNSFQTQANSALGTTAGSGGSGFSGGAGGGFGGGGGGSW